MEAVDVEYEIERDPLLADQTPRTLARRVEEVLTTLQRSRSGRCAACGGALCGHESIMSMVLGFKNEPHCVACLAAAVGRDRGTLGDELAAYILSKECLSIGWCWSKMHEPSCAWSAAKVETRAAGGPGASVEPDCDAAWEAGDTGCGDLVLELRTRIAALRPGQVIKVTARDPGAPQDMPAWCGLTGHSLLYAHHPVYFIRRKEA